MKRTTLKVGLSFITTFLILSTVSAQLAQITQSEFTGREDESNLSANGSLEEFLSTFSLAVETVSPEETRISSTVKFYTEYNNKLADAGLAQLYRPTVRYNFSFDVNVAPGQPYQIVIDRVARGQMKATWLGETEDGGDGDGTASITYARGAIEINGELISVQGGPIPTRTARESAPNPGATTIEVSGTASPLQFVGPQSFTISVQSSGPELSHVQSNYQAGVTSVNLGLNPNLGSDLILDEATRANYGDFVTIRIIQCVAPTIALRKEDDDSLVVEFVGILETSEDLIRWKALDPQPTSPYTFIKDTSRLFLRAASICPE